ncbi:MAG: pentapeptide repeat-containing protein, partial [bacterium]|nr:pentapeptide repeat-containing protein [bacterium]
MRLGLDDPEFLSLAIPVSILHATSNSWTPDRDEPVLLTGAILPKADWQDAHLDDSTLRRVNLRGANLRGVHLGRVHGHCSDLSGADLTQAQAHKGGFGDAFFHRAVLDGANFSNAF